MKTLALVLLVVACISRVSVAQGQALAPPHIMVNGTAVTEVVPNRLNWTLEVKNVGLELPKVADSHAQKIAAVLAALKEKGVPDKDVQTAQMQFSENRVIRKNEWVREGYQAVTSVAFKLSDLTKYKSLWQTLAELSGVSVSGVSFDHSDRVTLNKDTRVKALKAAKEKAEAMAQVFGSKVGEPLAVEEDLSVPEGGRGYNTANGISNFSTPVAGPEAQGENGEMLAPGSMPIVIRVRVTFRLLNAEN